MSRVFLHGFGGHPQSWAPLVSALPGRSLAPALPGHAGNAPPSSWAQAVGSLAAHLAEEPGSLELVGYSLGARLGAALLLDHPQRFHRATLIGAAFGLESEAERDARRAEDQRWAELLEGQGLETFFAAWDRRPLFAGRPAPQAGLRAAHHPAALAVAMRALSLGEMPSLWPRLGQLSIPVTLVVGERDAKFRPLAERAARLIPHATVVVVPGAGHDVLAERPEALLELLAGAARRYPGGR